MYTGTGSRAMLQVGSRQRAEGFRLFDYDAFCAEVSDHYIHSIAGFC
jgi:hypothetical protein